MKEQKNTPTQQLIEAGAEEVKSYSLINNYGYTFLKGGKKYDLRHWLNCYGAEVDFWEVGGKSLNTFEEAVAFIKTL